MLVPVPVLDGADEVAVDGLDLCARHAGRVRCWGAAAGGRLGVNDDTTTASEPTDRAIDLGVGFAVCAAREDGRVVCWGLASGGRTRGGLCPLPFLDPVSAP